MPLSDLAVKKAKPRDKSYKITDERGMYLIVNPNGSKWWRLDFTLPSKPRRTMSLGVYPDVELADARERREDIRKLVAKGVDPVRARRGQAASTQQTFEAVARRWLAANKPRWCAHNYGVLQRRLERHVFSEIGTQDVRAIDPVDVVRLIRKIEANGTTELPRRMNTICGRIFRFAIAEGLKAADPTRVVVGALKRKPPVKHHSFIRPEDMGEFLLKFTTDIDEERRLTFDALMLTILTAARTTEIRLAHQSEFEDLDGPSPLWRVPARRMKARKEHLVPLSRQAAQLVRRLIARLPREQTLLFSRFTRSGALSENTMLFALYRLGYRGLATVHGFRRTFSTLANEAQPMWHPDCIERALAHFPADQVRNAYNAAEYLPQRRELLQWWADWMDDQLSIARKEAEITALIG